MDMSSSQGQLDLQLNEMVEVTGETVRWRARDVEFLSGKWDLLSKRIPQFTVEDFKATAEGPANPHIRTVVRRPLTATELPIPVGIVSNTYRLAQHADVIKMCLHGIQDEDIDPGDLHCELGLTPLGEWMNFRAYFPEKYSYTPSDCHKMQLRLECFNSVDGSSRLWILFGWFRIICGNGLIIGETKASLRDIHDEKLNLDVIPDMISDGVKKAKADLKRMKEWERVPIELERFRDWVDSYLAEKWGKKAACRIWYACAFGEDVKLSHPFESRKPSERSVLSLRSVPGAPEFAKNLFDVSQSLSWIATKRNGADERLEWQGQIPGIIENLRTYVTTASTN